jgi:hypothetical protein
MVRIDFPELREYLANVEGFENFIRKSAYICEIIDKNELEPQPMLLLNKKIYPSTIIVKMPDGSFTEFWNDVYVNERNVLFEVRLAEYSEYYLVY